MRCVGVGDRAAGARQVLTNRDAGETLLRSAFFAMLLIGLAMRPGMANAELALVLSDDGAGRIELANTDRFMQRAEVEGIGVARITDCRTLGSRLLPLARQPSSTDGAGLFARYNLVNLWLDNLCWGKSDALPAANEARSWLLDLAGLYRVGDSEPFLDAHQMLAQLYLFGAPGSPPDYASAARFLKADAERHPKQVGLYLAFAYDHGMGLSQDHEAARRWIANAAAAGKPERQDFRNPGRRTWARSSAGRENCLRRVFRPIHLEHASGLVPTGEDVSGRPGNRTRSL